MSRRATFHLRSGTESDAESIGPSSRPSSPALQIPRSTSPVPQSLGEIAQRAREAPVSPTAPAKRPSPTDIGILPDEVYDRYLSWPVAATRRVLVKSLRKETPFLKWQQDKMRTKLRDRYFVYTSLLGTHSFFLIFLPMSFWLGSPYFARGLVNVLAFGVYFSSAIKDRLCVPRPYSPPVTRLTIGTHHLEYGFPSTHSTNAVSIAGYIYLWVLELRREYGGGVWNSYLWEVFLLYYACSVVYGRIYSGMHSIVDCVSGSALGLGIVFAQWGLFGPLEAFLRRSDLSVPLVVIPIGLAMVSIHPQPLDDCPCFEDAIAFIAVAMGVMVSRWVAVNTGVYPPADHPFLQHKALRVARLFPPGQGWADALEHGLDSVVGRMHALIQMDRTSPDLGASIAASTLKMIIGITLVVLTRLVMKSVCNLVLPRVIRFFYETFGLILPRRHYTPATEYNTVPMDKLRAVPSILDLPDTLTPTSELGQRSTNLLSPDVQRRGGSGSLASPGSSRGPSPSPLHERNAHRLDFKMPNGKDVGVPLTQSRPGSPTPLDPIAEKISDALRSREKSDKKEDVKHYDAEVLTKVVVYFSIGFNSTLTIPLLFARLGLGQ